MNRWLSRAAKSSQASLNSHHSVTVAARNDAPSAANTRNTNTHAEINILAPRDANGRTTRRLRQPGPPSAALTSEAKPLRYRAGSRAVQRIDTVPGRASRRHRPRLHRQATAATTNASRPLKNPASVIARRAKQPCGTAQPFKDFIGDLDCFASHGMTIHLFVCNFAPVVRRHYRVGVPHGGKYQELLNSDALEYGGAGTRQQRGGQCGCRTRSQPAEVPTV